MALPGAGVRNQAEETHYNIPSSFPLDSSVSLLEDTNPTFPNKSL